MDSNEVSTLAMTDLRGYCLSGNDALCYVAACLVYAKNGSLNGFVESCQDYYTDRQIAISEALFNASYTKRYIDMMKNDGRNMTKMDEMKGAIKAVISQYKLNETGMTDGALADVLCNVIVEINSAERK